LRYKKITGFPSSGGQGRRNFAESRGILKDQDLRRSEAHYARGYGNQPWGSGPLHADRRTANTEYRKTEW
jgi:hypothetical protein